MQVSLSGTTQNSTQTHQVFAVYLNQTKKGSKKSKAQDFILKSYADSWRDFWSKKVKQLSLEVQKGKIYLFDQDNGYKIFVVLGTEENLKAEEVGHYLLQVVNRFSLETTKLLIHWDTFVDKLETHLAHQVFRGALDAILLGSYQYDQFLSQKKIKKLNEVFFATRTQKEFSRLLDERVHMSKAMNFARDLVNCPPNILTSAELTKRVADDVKKDLGNKVKIRILDKEKIKKEKMNLLLAVNQGSVHPPHVVHLSYNPPVFKGQKHIALVGKGLVFDTGGASLKPGASMMGMKTDMAGAATVYAAFKAAALLGCPHRLSCFLGVTDNLLGSRSILPDSIVKGRAGITVEILNTDAEGRLVLADVINYAQDFGPDVIFDVATLTGACAAALGEATGVMGNDEPLMLRFIESTKKSFEHACIFPLFDFYKENMKSKIADLKNIGGFGAQGGAQLAAGFLLPFIKPGVKWVHLDIAGVAMGSDFIPYFPKHLASARMVRSLTETLLHGTF